MKVFIAGASGAIGRRLVPRLVEAGHDVIGMTRSPERASQIERLGARAVVRDAFDAAKVEAEVASSRPDAIVNQLTSLPQAMKPRKLKEYYEANDAVRREGSRVLLAAARKAGVTRLVVQSTAFWYAPRRDGLMTEDDPPGTDAPEPIGAAVRTMKQVEDDALASGIDAVVLRYGFFYGPGTWYAPDGDVGRQIASRRYPIIGRGTGVFSFVHIDDAAEATARALEAPPGVYNVVDDDPAPMHVWLPEMASALGAKRPMKVPRTVAMLAAGRGPVRWMEQLRGADASKAKRELGWRPRHSSWRDGFREALAPESRGSG